MRAFPVSAALTTAIVLAASLCLTRSAFAADLYGESYAEPPYDAHAYADDIEEGAPPPARYDGRYREGPPPQARYQEPYDDEPASGSIKDGYPVPMPPPAASAPPPRYAERPPLRAKRYERYACLERWQIRRELRREGWRDVRPMGGDGGIVNIHARRGGSGQPFHLRVDRCSGEVLAAHPSYRTGYRGGLAYRDWRWVK